ncbi:hypothetical protein [Deinococcus radiophilus]|uniref:hypothetical protein n=1 Tax=Deinococcus radiophilus TaxID=32062 RepID=UPI0036220BFC
MARKAQRTQQFGRGLVVLSLSALLGLMPAALDTGWSSAQAQSGGGFGGSSSGGFSGGGGGGFSGGGYSGGGYSGGGYSGGGGFFPVPMGGPVIIGGGGGGGSIIGLVMFGMVMMMVMGSMQRAMRGGGARGLSSGGMEDIGARAVLVQVALTHGDEVKAALQDVARRGDPDSDEAWPA